MKKFVKLYEKNAVIRFLLSYLLVLVIPFGISIAGTALSLSQAQQVMEKSNIQMITYTAENLEREVNLMRNLAYQVSHCNELDQVIDWSGEKNSSFYMKVKALKEEISQVVSTRGTELLSGIDTFLTSSNTYLNIDGCYDSEFFYQWKSERSDISYDDWTKIYSDEKIIDGLYYHGGKLQYIFPLEGNQGAVVCNFDMKRLQDYLSISQISDDSMICLLHISDETYTINEQKDAWIPELSELTETSGMLLRHGDCVFYSKSMRNQFAILLSLPTTSAFHGLQSLITVEIILFIVAALGAIVISFLLSRRSGRVVNAFFSEFSDGDIPYSVENMGKTATDIMASKQQVVELIEKERPLLEQALLGKLIRGEEAGDNELDSLAEQVGFDIDAHRYQVVLYRIYNNIDPHDADLQTIEDSRVISFYVRNLISEYFTKNVWFYELNCLTTVVLYIPDDEEDVVKDMISYVEKHLSMEGTTKPFWGAAKATNSAMKIWRVVEKARYSLYNVSSPGLENLKYYGDVMQSLSNFYFSDQYRERLRSSIISDDRGQITELMNISKAENFEHGSVLSRNRFLKLNTAFVNTITSVCEQQPVMDAVQKLNELAMFYGDWEIQKYYDLLQKVIFTACDCMNSAKKSKSANMVEEMKYFVEKHYSDSGLGLSMMSQNFHISEGYVSMLFKDQAGTNFAEYVEQLRINHAIQLLKEGSLSVQEISEQVGYNSIQSFRRAIKRITGKTPREVRDGL